MALLAAVDLVFPLLDLLGGAAHFACCSALMPF